MFSNFSPRKSRRLWDNVEKCGGAREAADNNAAARYKLKSKATRAQAQPRCRAPTQKRAYTHANTHRNT